MRTYLDGWRACDIIAYIRICCFWYDLICVCLLLFAGVCIYLFKCFLLFLFRISYFVRLPVIVFLVYLIAYRSFILFSYFVRLSLSRTARRPTERREKREKMVYGQFSTGEYGIAYNITTIITLILLTIRIKLTKLVILLIIILTILIILITLIIREKMVYHENLHEACFVITDNMMLI